MRTPVLRFAMTSTAVLTPGRLPWVAEINTTITGGAGGAMARRLRSRPALSRLSVVHALVAVAALTGAGCQGGASSGTPPPAATTSVTTPDSTTPDSATASALPPMTHFRIGSDGIIYDCRADGDSIGCRVFSDNRQGGMTSYEGDFTGTLSGLIMTGTTRVRMTSWDQMDPQCTFEQEVSGPVTYTFRPDGTGMLRDGPAKWRQTSSGSCSGTHTGEYAVVEYSEPWTKVE